MNRAAMFFCTMMVFNNVLWAAQTTATLSPSQHPQASLPFVLNQGQFDSEIFALASTLGASFAVTKSGELLLQVPTTVQDQPDYLTVRQRFVDAHVGDIRAVTRSATKVNVFYGQQQPQQRSQAATYEQISLGEIYTGINLTLHAQPHNIEQIYQLAAGAEVDQIAVSVDGIQGMAVLENGELALETSAGLVRYSKPLAYQYSDTQCLFVEVEYRVETNAYGFRLGDYDASLPVFIDPMLATYLGGSELEDNWALTAQYVAADGELYVYAVGATPSSAASFPQHTVGAQADVVGDKDVYIARLDHELRVLDLTFLGGSGRDEAFAVVVHPVSKSIYVTGLTESDNFPTSPDTGRGRAGGRDVFVARLSVDLATLEQSRYLGGSSSDSGMALFFDDRMQGDQTPDTIYVAGTTKSSNFAGVSGGAQAQLGGDGSQTDGFAARLTEDLDLLQATFLGGMSTDSAADIAVDPITRTVYVVGQTFYNYRQDVSVGDFPWTNGGARSFGGQNDAYVVHLASDLRQAFQATYLGGSGIDFGTALAIHPLNGDVYVTGSTSVAWDDFPSGGAFTTLAGSQDAFIARLNPTLKNVLGATYFGGRQFDRATDALIKPLASTEIYIAGRTSSSDVPGTTGGAQETSSGGDEAFVARLSVDLSELRQASYYGGSGYDGCEGHCLAWGNDPTDGNIYIFISGNAESLDLPGVTAGVVQTAKSSSTDSFVARFDGSLLAQVIEDMDQDGVADANDNCVQTANSDQLDTDRDHEGDACDGDDDNDNVVDGSDNCPRHRNPTQSDGDQDGFGNLCDNCPQVSNQDQLDSDNDGVGDACADGHSGPLLALLQDPVDPIIGDRVKFVVEAQDADSIAAMTLFVDGTPVKTCFKEHCEYETRPAAEAPEFAYLAVDALGYYSTGGNVPESATTVLDAGSIFDADNDGIFDLADNCRGVANADQADYDGDGVGDACDQCCPGCAEAVFELAYCCMPSYGYGGSCTDDLMSSDRYYWELAYDLVATNGCGCMDTDGNNPFDRGVVFVENQSPQNCRYVLGHFVCDPARSSCDDTEDYCIDNNTVREYLCDADGLTYRDTDCPAVNPVCSDGRCDCPDTDGGEYYFRQGTLLDHTDECYIPSWTSEFRLREYYCGRDTQGRLELNERTVRCEYGCSQGRCRCEDSDGGISAAFFGRMGLQEDTCIDARTLSEVYPEVVHEGTGSCEIRTREITCDGLCVDGACQPETCEDRVQNQGEDGIDCGGPCELPCDLCSVTESTLPTRFDWRDWRGRSWVTQVRNQEQCGSCWAFAAVAAVESKYLIESTPGWIPDDFYNPPSPTTWHLPNLSEQTLVSECGDAWGDCTGGGKNDALDEIEDTGIVDEDCFPYSSGSCIDRDGDCVCGSNAHCTSPRSCPSTCADTGLDDWDERRWYITSHHYVNGTNDVANVKDALLCHGPLATCSSDWGHCITIIGWDNDSQICRDAYGLNRCWIIKNSHGIQNGWQGNGDRYDDDYWTVDGVIYLPFDDHDYSYQVRSNVHYVRSVTPATSWVAP